MVREHLLLILLRLMVTIRWKLREVMARKKITNEYIGTAMSKHPGTISRWRSADKMPSLSGEELEALCHILQCSLFDLLSEETEKQTR